MKSTGILRKVDHLGRVVLPVELRRAMEIEEGDDMEIYVEDNCVILQKYEPTCVFCGSSRELVSFHRKNVCQGCVDQLIDY